jgi:hypothetical protein
LNPRNAGQRYVVEIPQPFAYSCANCLSTQSKNLSTNGLLCVNRRSRLASALSSQCRHGVPRATRRADPGTPGEPYALKNFGPATRSVFLADTVYCMSRSPGRFVVKRDIELPRPRDLEVTYTPQFTDIVHELRGHIGAFRQPISRTGVAVPP